MDKLTAKKIIEINHKKDLFSEVTKNNYDLFVDNLDNKYIIEVCKELSIADTPVILIKSNKNKINKEAYFWCFEDAFYFKTFERTFVSFVLSDIFDFITEYFL